MEENNPVQANEIQEETASRQGFDELLRDRDIQSEFDRRVSRALETARGKWAQETRQQIEQAKSEAERLARMTTQERAAHEFQERETELNAREREISRRELRAEALRALSERGLPSELGEALSYADAQSVQKSLDAAERAFRAAVQSGVEERLRGTLPRSAQAVLSQDSDEEYYRARAASASKSN